ncbi:MAG: DUF1572 domain-containing protein [Chitinophagaceae bacterium]|nr:DUF1572 domain-containing protein [Chitinophagaceae bacterium]
MSLSATLAGQYRKVYTGGNWTDVNLNQVLADVDWKMATAKVTSFNSILALTYHIHYFIHAMLQVLEGRPLDAHDKFSFDHPAVNNEEDWQQLQETTRTEVLQAAALIEQMPEEKLWENFFGEKYGSWYNNIQGTIEHSYYHLGQIVIIKKMLKAQQL